MVIGRWAFVAVFALVLTGCHKDAEEVTGATKPIAAPPQRSPAPLSAQDSEARSGAAAANVLAGKAVEGNVSASNVAVGNSSPTTSPPLQQKPTPVIPPPSSANKSATAAGGTHSPGAAGKPSTPAVSLSSLKLPTIDPARPVTLGPGITIGEPKPERDNAPLTAFGAGCARWLNYAVVGLPQMGQVPVWASVTRFELRQHRANYQLTPQDAPALAHILGVTHAAVGQISGDPAHCVLTYQVVSIPDGKAVGPPLTLSGPQEQIVAGLPKLGAQIAQSLKISANVSLPTVGAASGDLTALGGLPWTDEGDMTPQQTQTARDLATRLAPAGLLLISGSRLDTGAQTQVAQALSRQGPDNGLALADLAVYARVAPREIVDAISRNAARYPNNYLYNAAIVRLRRVVGDLPGELKAFSRAVRVSPRNVNAWVGLSKALGTMANNLRKGRFATQISSSEWTRLSSLYQQQLQAAQKATEVDPENASAWLEVAEAGTFAGATQVAEPAYWKAVGLDKSDPEIHAWGLQMFQQKWGGNASDLQKVADIAADAPLKTITDRRRIATDLKEAGCDAQAESLYRKMQADAEAAVAHDPGNAQAHFDLAACYEAIKQDAQATREYKAAVGLRPDARAHYDVGEHYMRRGRYRDAAREFQETLRLMPSWGHVHLQLGLAFKEDRKFAEADQELRNTLSYSLSVLDVANVHFYLAKLKLEKNQFPEAAKEFEASIKAGPMYPESYEWLCTTYAEMKQYKQAIEIGLKGKQLNPYSVMIYDSLSYAYAMTNQPQLSIAQCRIALRLQPNDVTAHENMGDELYKLGKKEEARAEWQTVLRLAPNSPPAKEAQTNLAKK